MQIKVENLSFTYNASASFAVKALNNVNLEINEGDFFGIIGHTGSGKSTFIQHLNGLIKIGKNSGNIFIGNFNLADNKCDYKLLRSKVGMVFQYPEQQLFAETVKDDVAFGIKNFFTNISENQIEEMVRLALNQVGLNYFEVKDKVPFELSGGQKRRVAIAGVIVTKPEILILDEPAVGLDPKGRREFIELLNNLHKTSIKTIIIVSHDMDLIAENCNKIAVFSKGEIVKLGTPKQIFSKPTEIKQFGLDLPLTAYLTEELNSKGINIENNYTIKDFINAVKHKKGIR